MCKEFQDIDLGNVESTFRSNVLQMLAVTMFALPHLKRGSSIINTTSVTAYKGSANLSTSSQLHHRRMFSEFSYEQSIIALPRAPSSASRAPWLSSSHRKASA